MATYGYHQYWNSKQDGSGVLTKYGPSFVGSGFDLAPITVRESGYGQVTLSWVVPSQDISWSRIRVVRSSAGFPVTEDDGTTSLEVSSTDSKSSFTDRGLTGGVYYYYSFFVETDLPNYNTGITYTKSAFVKNVGGQAYVSIQDNNLNHPLTDTAWWAPTSVTKSWVLSGQVAALATKRYDHTTALYQGLPRAYRGEEIDWAEPESDQYGEYLDPPSNWPALGRFLSVFGFHLDGAQTKTDTLTRLWDTSAVPEWYLDAMSQHLGFNAEKITSPRIQRMRLKNAAALARSRGTLVSLQSQINAALDLDATVTISPNLMLSKDVAEMSTFAWPTWHAADQYVAGAIVRYGDEIFQALQDASGEAQKPTTGVDNSYWNLNPGLQASTQQAPVQERETMSVFGWASENRSATPPGRVTLIATSDPDDSRNLYNGAALSFTGTGASGSLTYTYTHVPTYHAPAWASGTAYVAHDLVTYNSMIWRARTSTTGTTPGADYSIWELFLDRVPSGVDPDQVFKKAIPIKSPGSPYTASAYVSSTNRDVWMLIDWYNSSGVFISTTTGGLTNTTGWSRRTVTGTAPTGAAYAAVRIAATLPITATYTATVRKVQFEQSAAATPYQTPRKVTVRVAGAKSNFALNSSFEKTDGTLTTLRDNLHGNPSLAQDAFGWGVKYPSNTTGPAYQTLLPVADVSATNFTKSGGSFYYEALDEYPSSADGLTVRAVGPGSYVGNLAPTGVLEVALGDVTANGLAISPPTIYVQGTGPYSTSNTLLKISLMQGATEIASYNPAFSSVGSIEVGYTLTPAQMSEITDWTDLRLRFEEPPQWAPTPAEYESSTINRAYVRVATGTSNFSTPSNQSGWPDGVTKSGRQEFTSSVTTTGEDGVYTLETGAGSVVPGQSYVASAYLRSSDAIPAAVRMEWRNTSGIVSTTTSGYSALTGTAARRSVGGTAPAGADRVRVVSVVQNGTSVPDGAWIEMTAVMVEESAFVLMPYFDGNTPSANGYTYVWAAGPRSVSSQKALAPTIWAASGAVIGSTSEKYQYGTGSAVVGWLPAASGAASVYQDLTGLTAGVQYSLGLDVFIPTGSPSVTVGVQGIGQSAAVTARDQWVRATYTFTATVSTHRIQVVNSDAAVKGNRVFLDGAQVKPGAVAEAYSPGDDAADVSYRDYLRKRYRLDDIVRENVPYDRDLVVTYVS